MMLMLVTTIHDVYTDLGIQLLAAETPTLPPSLYRIPDHTRIDAPLLISLHPRSVPSAYPRPRSNSPASPAVQNLGRRCPGRLARRAREPGLASWPGGLESRNRAPGSLPLPYELQSRSERAPIRYPSTTYPSLSSIVVSAEGRNFILMHFLMHS